MDECTEICYKDPVLKDRQWSAYIDRSPGADRYSEVPYLFPSEILQLSFFSFFRGWGDIMLNVELAYDVALVLIHWPFQAQSNLL